MTAARGRWWGVVWLALLVVAPVSTEQTASPPVQAQAPPADLTVPADLKPLLAATQSELRLVSLLYSTDRATLAGNFDTGRGADRGGGGAGRGGREGGE